MYVTKVLFEHFCVLNDLPIDLNLKKYIKHMSYIDNMSLILAKYTNIKIISSKQHFFVIHTEKR